MSQLTGNSARGLGAVCVILILSQVPTSQDRASTAMHPHQHQKSYAAGSVAAVETITTSRVGHSAPKGLLEQGLTDGWRCAFTIAFLILR